MVIIRNEPGIPHRDLNPGPPQAGRSEVADRCVKGYDAVVEKILELWAESFEREGALTKTVDRQADQDDDHSNHQSGSYEKGHYGRTVPDCAPWG